MCFLLWSLVSCMWVLRQTPSTYMYNFYNHIWCSWTVSVQCAVFCMWVRLRQTRSGDKRGRFDWLVIADSPLHTCCPGTFSRNFFHFCSIKKEHSSRRRFHFHYLCHPCQILKLFFSQFQTTFKRKDSTICVVVMEQYISNHIQSRGESTQERHKEEIFESTK